MRITRVTTLSRLNAGYRLLSRNPKRLRNPEEIAASHCVLWRKHSDSGPVADLVDGVEDVHAASGGHAIDKTQTSFAGFCYLMPDTPEQ
jgi:hypothetical protein